MSHKFPIRKCMIIVFWLLVWQTAATGISNDILLVGPRDVVGSLFSLVPVPDFWMAVGASFARICAGFLMAFGLGLALGCLAFLVPLVRELLEPVMVLMKSVPVASFVVLALIWTGAENLSVLISFLMVLPILYTHTVAGLESTDPRLLEMAQVFSATPWRRL